MNHFYKSKKFWAAVIGAVVAFAKAYGMDIPEEILWVIVSYIIGQGVADVGVYMAKEKKMGIPIPAVVRAPEITTPFFEPLRPIGIKDEEMPKPTTATRRFQEEWAKPYILTNPDDPAQVEVDYIGHYETVLELAKRMYEEQRGFYPTGIEDPCNTGDFSFESKWLWRANQELKLRKDQVASVKKNPAFKWQIDGLGYLLWSVPWNSCPQWVRLSLMLHVQTE